MVIWEMCNLNCGPENFSAVSAKHIKEVMDEPWDGEMWGRDLKGVLEEESTTLDLAAQRSWVFVLMTNAEWPNLSVSG